MFAGTFRNELKKVSRLGNVLFDRLYSPDGGPFKIPSLLKNTFQAER